MEKIAHLSPTENPQYQRFCYPPKFANELTITKPPGTWPLTQWRKFHYDVWNMMAGLVALSDHGIMGNDVGGSVGGQGGAGCLIGLNTVASQQPDMKCNQLRHWQHQRLVGAPRPAMVSRNGYPKNSQQISVREAELLKRFVIDSKPDRDIIAAGLKLQWLAISELLKEAGIAISTPADLPDLDAQLKIFP